jgi:hypothetical protein
MALKTRPSVPPGGTRRADEQSELVELIAVKRSPPIFVLGSYRSGTTLLFKLIRDYLDVGFGRDNGRFVRFKKLLGHYGDLSQDQNLRTLIDDVFDDADFRHRFKGLSPDPEPLMAAMEARTFAELVRSTYASYALMQGRKRWGGKTPEYVLHVPELLDLFPDVKLIHIIRDGRDVALSLFRMPWGAPRNCYAAAIFWKEWVSSAQSFGEALSPDGYLEVKYEHLLMNPADVFRKIIGFGQFEGDRDQIIDRFRQGVEATLRRDNFGKWKQALSPSQVRIFEQVAGDKLAELGYEVVNKDVVGKPVQPHLAAYYRLQNVFRKVKVEGYQGVTARWKYRMVALKRLGRPTLRTDS